jgi:quercetin dioxygenase-like cupin family protein
VRLTDLVHGLATGESYWGPGNRCTFLLTGEQSGGALFVFDCLVAPGGGPLPHRHLGEEETFYLYAGELEFSAGGQIRPVSVGELIYVPRGVMHSYRNVGQSDALMLTMFTPAGMEGWFRETFVPVDDPAKPPPPISDDMIERMLDAGSRYNVEWGVRD